MLQLKLDPSLKVYPPGATLSGTITWETEKAPRSIDAVLYWHTSGKGDDDTGDAIQQSWKPVQESGSMSFSWKLPRGPISLDGTLINIHWTLEVTIPGTNESATADIILSQPTRA